METNTAASKTNSEAPAKDSLNLRLLIALVVGSILGSGIFALPQNMAAGAGAGAILIGWTVTGIGMLALARVYQMLSIRKPDLNNGVYAYAKALSGDFVGFNSAWGYWVSAWIGNVGYLVAAFGALGYFAPIFGDGNTLPAIVGASIVLWAVHAMVLRGIQGATVLNAVITIAKIVPLLLFIILVAFAFQLETFKLNFWGNPQLGSVLDQVKSTMLVTVWVFIGIEGASVYSARAQKRTDVGRATVVGYLICLSLLIAVSVLSLGIYSQPELATLKNPSMAPVLEKVVGTWGAVLIYLGLIVSVGGGFLAWTLLAAESLFTPAQGGSMPEWLAKKNSKGVPANALWLTNGMVQLFLIITLVSKASYLALISLSTAMILIPYLFSAIYAFTISRHTQSAAIASNSSVVPIQPETQNGPLDFSIAVVATLFCGWLLFAAGIKYLLLSSILYLLGTGLYIMAKRQKNLPVFTSKEYGILAAIVALAAIAVYNLATGQLKL